MTAKQANYIFAVLSSETHFELHLRFYCPAVNLVIECDGSQHFTDDGLEADRIRADT